MLRQLLVALILYLMINQLILFFNTNENKFDMPENTPEIIEEKKKKISKNEKNVPVANTIESVVPLNLFGKPHEVVPNKFIIWTFTQPVPWSQIIYVYEQEYPFRFFLKIHIPSLNDYQAWKQIIPNIDFDSKTGELIIPSKNEESALAIANLIVSNFQGQLTIDNIIQKNLIQISVTKAQQYEVVKTKLREQIIEALNGQTHKLNRTNKPPSNDFEEDLAKSKNNVEALTSNSNHEVINSESKETFNNPDEPAAYELDNLAYL
jgi:hypothetical protein